MLNVGSRVLTGVLSILFAMSGLGSQLTPKSDAYYIYFFQVRRPVGAESVSSALWLWRC